MMAFFNLPYPNTRQNDSITARSLGCIRYLTGGSDNGFIATATFIAPHLVLTARHTLNGLACSDLQFVYNDVDAGMTKISNVSLVEDGAEFGQDYALLYIHENFGQPIDLIIDKPAEQSSFSCVRCLSNGVRVKLEAKVPMTSSEETLVFESSLGTKPGYSGAAYINSLGKMFGLHLSGYDEYSMWAGISTGISFSQLYANLAGRESFLHEFFSDRKQLPQCYQPNYFFDDDAIFALKPLGQIDEGAREAALGSTPQLGSLTETQVLLRYWLSGKARLAQNQRLTTEQFCLLQQLKTPRLQQYVTSYCMRRDKNNFTKIDSKIFNIFSEINKWEVLVKVPQRQGDFKNLQTSWVNLGSKVQHRNRQVAALQMGHKMGAVEYWAYGAGDGKTKGWLHNERRSMLSNVKYPTVNKKNEKLVGLANTRYRIFQRPGYLNYSKYPQVLRSFMLCPENYHFQWWAVNQHDGRIAGIKTKYKNYAPQDHEWQGHGQSIKLVPK